ncbi:transcriptional regulator [Streptomyces daqingensis]|uniref:Transcriptional regulator n=1 Tax=Streptomyces daqingensis TaxID=1472640 RepID=A0ABQ2MIA4_9ACTN|nr:helix-turn-helix transcriptional regulator [Streptomyces daqingensis]GGO52693.1 transcriptional regulator [Streptomyces daqingensis]
MPAPKELDPSASLAALYGAKIRKLRTRAGWTQRELGDRVPVAHSRIAQFELGNETPPEDVAGKLDQLLGADGDLTDLWKHVRRTPIPDWARKFVAYEARARKMRKFSQIIPGLAQTEAYARAVLLSGQIYDDADVEAKVSARLDRQSVLERPDPPWVWIILDEAVLYRVVEGPSTMREQLAHLLELGGRPRIHMQVLPFKDVDPAAMGGSFTLLSLPDGGEVAYEEGIVFGRLVEDSEAVVRRSVLYDRLQASALSPTASAGLIRGVMEEHYSCASDEMS